jgi:single-stranded DNA-specific DHH superfamily exonuclease
MGIIKNNIELSNDTNILLDKWKIESVEGLNKPSKPGLCIFNNTARALSLLDRHIRNNGRMCLHTDVDVDGIGTTYILKKTLEVFKINSPILLINKDKVHGILPKHAEFFNAKKCIDLMIITDSSCNELDTIKSFNCDVLVIDHHEILHNELSGKCNDGVHEFVIVDNVLSNSNQEYDIEWLKGNGENNNMGLSAFDNVEQYIGTDDMSCGLVIYELMRVYCLMYDMPDVLEDMMLYQWVGITLFTDVINTLNERNQWYLDNTVFNRDVEKSLKIMLSCLNKYKATLDKSFIEYTLAPIINKTIRAGESSLALSTVIKSPDKIAELKKFDALQKENIEKATMLNTTEFIDGQEVIVKRPIVFSGDTIILDISKFGIHPNYCGVIASKLSSENNKDTAVFIINDEGLCRGSFRGRYRNIDYRKYFDDYAEEIYAQGHPSAFGFELTMEQLNYLMSHISDIEPKAQAKDWLTMGNMTPEEYGEYHIKSLEDFKKQGYIWRIATGNSKVTSTDEINIHVKASDVMLKNTQGKLYLYDVLGLECKAFEPLQGNYFDIYMELNKEIDMYIR